MKSSHPQADAALDWKPVYRGSATEINPILTIHYIFLKRYTYVSVLLADVNYGRKKDIQSQTMQQNPRL